MTLTITPDEALALTCARGDEFVRERKLHTQIERRACTGCCSARWLIRHVQARRAPGPSSISRCRRCLVVDMTWPISCETPAVR